MLLIQWQYYDVDLTSCIEAFWGLEVFEIYLWVVLSPPAKVVLYVGRLIFLWRGRNFKLIQYSP